MNTDLSGSFVVSVYGRYFTNFCCSSCVTCLMNSSKLTTSYSNMNCKLHELHNKSEIIKKKEIWPFQEVSSTSGLINTIGRWKDFAWNLESNSNSMMQIYRYGHGYSYWYLSRAQKLWTSHPFQKKWTSYIRRC